jgi:hypothetical protein
MGTLFGGKALAYASGAADGCGLMSVATLSESISGLCRCAAIDVGRDHSALLTDAGSGARVIVRAIGPHNSRQQFHKPI